jgi:DNA-directed RNA polymerase beta subunit
MKTKILCIMLFITPMMIKPMEGLTKEFIDEHCSEPERDRKINAKAHTLKQKRAKSMLVLDRDLLEEDTSNDSDSSILSGIDTTIKFDVIDLLNVYFGTIHTGEEPYCNAVEDALTYYRDNKPDQFKEIAYFLESIKINKDKKKAFNKDFLHNKRYSNIQLLLNTIVQNAIAPILEKKKLKVKKTECVCRAMTVACIGSFVIWCGVIIAAVVPVAVQC